MLAFVFAPFFIALLIFVFIRTIKHIKTFNIKGIEIAYYVIGFVFFGGICCIITGFLLPTGLELKRFFTRIGYYWLGLVLYFFISLGISLIIRSIMWLILKNNSYDKKIARNCSMIFVVVFTTIMSIYGISNAHKLRITNYDVEINKKSSIKDMNIVLVADLHIGYNDSLEEMVDMVNKVNELDPDIVIVAGDIFDNEYDAIDNPDEITKVLSSIKAKYGKYAVYGNHDIDEKILLGFTFSWIKGDKNIYHESEEMIDFIKKSDFTLLSDSYEIIEDSICIYGRPDKSRVKIGAEQRKTPSEISKVLNKDDVLICIDHQPSELEELSNAGFDLDLSGHTHNGQIWPGTLTINLAWDNAYGMKKINDMYSIVTSGVGLFGINMRTGCYPEIVNINLHTKN